MYQEQGHLVAALLLVPEPKGKCRWLLVGLKRAHMGEHRLDLTLVSSIKPIQVSNVVECRDLKLYSPISAEAENSPRPAATTRVTCYSLGTHTATALMCMSAPTYSIYSRGGSPFLVQLNLISAVIRVILY